MILAGPRVTGYTHAAYAASLAEFGAPRRLPRSGGWILERRIEGTSYRDAMGCYPLFACNDWTVLHEDLRELQVELVSISIVADPFGSYALGDLQRAFGDRVSPFKEHYVADLSQPLEQIVSKHHRYYARRALSSLRVDRTDEPAQFLDEWVALYDNLELRHELKGIQAFSRFAFNKQLRVPGAVMLRAIAQDQTVGAHLWYRQDEVAHSHLAAFSDRGYELMASYALYWSALEMFKSEVRWLNFGAGAGLDHGANDGLTRFKRGWATGTRTAYFCGRILDSNKYAEILSSRGIPENDYFPAYRRGEFV